jgi:hypothetical protein
VFTGIVEELGRVVAIEPQDDAVRLRISGPLVTSDAVHGASIAVNGVCLTVVEHGDGEFVADVMQETLDRSSLGALVEGAPVNLERPVTLEARLGGHLVQGHVDGTGTILERTPSEHWEVVRVSLPDDLGRYVVREGVDHRRRHLAHGRGGRARLLHHLAHPYDARAHHARHQAGRRPREPRGRRRRQVRRAHARVEDRMSTPEHQQYDGVRLDSVEDAVAAIRAGQAVVVVDDEDRENEGDLIFASQRATAALTGFMIRHTSGYICVAMRATSSTASACRR